MIPLFPELTALFTYLAINPAWVCEKACFVCIVVELILLFYFSTLCFPVFLFLKQPGTLSFIFFVTPAS